MNGGATKAPGGTPTGNEPLAFPVGSLVMLACQEAHSGAWRGPMEVVGPVTHWAQERGVTMAVHPLRGRGGFSTSMLVPYTDPSIPTKLKACAALLLKGEAFGLVDACHRLGWNGDELHTAVEPYSAWKEVEALWMHSSDEDLATFLLFCAEALRAGDVS